MTLETIVSLAGRVVLLLQTARQLGLTPNSELAERVLRVIERVGSLGKQAGESAKRAIEELDSLTKEIEAVEVKISAGAGAAALKDAFEKLDSRAEVAVTRLLQAASNRG